MKTRHFFAPQKEAHRTAISLGISEFTFALFLTLTELLFAQALPPYHVDIVGHFGGEIQCLSLRDSNGFVKQGEYFKVLDMTSPALAVLGSCPLPGDIYINEMYLRGNLCCLRSRGSRMLVIIDVSDPRHPRELGELSFGSKPVEEFAFYNDYVYAAQQEEGVRILDAADPANPTLAGTFSSNALSIAVQGNRAYVVEAGSTPLIQSSSNFLVIYDITDPLNPVELGRTKVFKAREVAVSGEYAYTAGNLDSRYAGVRCIRVSDPAHPAVVDSTLVTTIMGSPKVENNLLFLNKLKSSPTDQLGIFIFDIANPPGKLVKKGEWIAPALIEHYAVQSSWLYAVVNTSDPIRKINTSNPQNPVEAQKYDFPSFPLDVVVYGNHLFIGDMYRLYRYEISNPEAPVYAGHIQWPGLGRLCVRNNVLYAIEDLTGKLKMWDISDFTNSHSLADINPPAGDPFQELSLRGNYLYLGTQLGKVQVWDVSNPQNPTKKGELNWPNVTLKDLYVPESGDLIYAAYAHVSGQSEYQVKIINVANPQAPQVVNTLETTGLPSALAGEGDFFYVVSNLLQESRWILSAYDVSNPAGPVLADTLQGSGQNWELEVKDGVLIGTFPGGSVRYFVWDQVTRQWIPGPEVHSGYDIRVATTADPQGTLVSYVPQGKTYGLAEWGKKSYGMEGIKIIKARKRGPNNVVLTTSVNPPEAAAAGCTTVPAPGPHIYPKNVTVSLKAEEVSPWNFFHWTGDVSGNDRNVNVFMDRDKIATANFVKPILNLSGGKGAQHFCPTDPDLTTQEIIVLPLTLSVNDVAGWMVYSIQFKASGEAGHEKNDIELVKLYMGNQLLSSGTYSSDNDTISLNVHQMISPGSSINLRLAYKFKSEVMVSPPLPKYFNVETKVSLVNAKPTNPPYENYEKLPPGPVTGGPVVIAPVWNEDTGEGFGTIQAAIDDADTKDTHFIEVCPGIYTENVDVTKSLLISSKGGAAVTFVQAKNSKDHVFHLMKDEILIEGFTIKGANGKDVIGNYNWAGIYVHGSALTGCNINQCKIEKNGYGLYLNNATNTRVKGNTFSENEVDGIHIGGASIDNTIEKNVISANNSDGIEIEGQNARRNNIQSNIIGLTEDKKDTWGNKKNGVFINGAPENIIGKEDIGDNLIAGNYGNGVEISGTTAAHNEVISNNISSNQGDGVLIKNALHNLIGDSLKGNVIGNNEHGVHILGESATQNIVKYNTIVMNLENGVFIENAHENIIGSLAERLEWLGTDVWGASIAGDQQISGNGKNGIEICGVQARGNQILGNEIGIYRGMGYIGNSENGVLIKDAPENIIGGNDSREGNLIVKSGRNGIHIYGEKAKKTQVRWNEIGTLEFYASSGRSIKFPNGENGVLIENVPENIICHNIIQNNEGDGVLVLGAKAMGNRIYFRNLIYGNKRNGISISNAPKNSIGADCSISPGNEISSNGGHGVWVYGEKAIGNEIIGNSIGPNNGDGLFIENASETIVGGITDKADNIFCKSGRYGVHICGASAQRNQILHNSIHANEADGVFIESGVDNSILSNWIKGNNGSGVHITGHTTSKLQSRPPLLGDNTISENTINGVLIERSHGAWIKGNTIEKNQQNGIHLQKSVGNELSHNNISSNKKIGLFIEEGGFRLNRSLVSYNRIWHNCTGIKEIGSTSLFQYNSIYNNYCNTGIHLDNSSSEIISNTVCGDEGDGIKCENSSNPLITHNNIFQNKGFGLNNLDPSVTINAQGNWWGAASGPAGVGSGSGDEVSGKVDFSDWRNVPLTLKVSAEKDTIQAPVGSVDSVSVLFQNLHKFTDTLNVTITDSLGWVVGTTSFTLSLRDSFAVTSKVRFALPANIPDHTINRVKVRAVSQSDVSSLDEDSFLIIAYQARLTRIVISPDSVVLGQGHKQKFTAQGLDQCEQTLTFNPVWSSTGGTIDTTGLYNAGTDTGDFIVTAKDIVTQVEAQAKVRVIPALPRLTQVILYPDSVVLFPKQQKQFSVFGFDQFDSVFVFTPLWAATGGTIDKKGLYTAPPDTGGFVIVIKDSATSLSDMTKVQVVPQRLTLLSPPDGAQDVSIAPTFRWLPYPDASFFVLEVALNSSFTQMVSRDTLYWQTQYSVGPLTGLTMYYWRVWAVIYKDSAVVSETRSFRTYKTGVEDRQTVPERFALYQNYPNPFNPKTTITFDTAEKSRVQLVVYDVLGRKVQILTDQVYPVGRHDLVWDTFGLPSGVYFIRMNARGSLQKFTAVRKVMLIR